jgi:putative DNA primase/helicase
MTSPLEYVARGWKIFPCYSIQRGQCTCSKGIACQSPGKHPLTKNGVTDATTNLQTVQAWEQRFPNCNWAVATGQASGIVVIDIDPRNGGYDSIEEYETYRPDGPLPDTLRSSTGGGGKHLFYTYPPTR